MALPQFRLIPLTFKKTPSVLFYSHEAPRTQPPSQILRTESALRCLTPLDKSMAKATAKAPPVLRNPKSKIAGLPSPNSEDAGRSLPRIPLSHTPRLFIHMLPRILYEVPMVIHAVCPKTPGFNRPGNYPADFTPSDLQFLHEFLILGEAERLILAIKFYRYPKMGYLGTEHKGCCRRRNQLQQSIFSNTSSTG